jgi:hypothetical protein
MENKKIFSETITDDQYSRLTSRSIAYERKPSHPDDIRSSINFDELHESVREIVSNLPTVEFKGSFFNGILDGDQQFYLMTHEEKIYLVDTQGFTYARYVIQLKDLVRLERADTILMRAHPGSVETVIDILNHMEVDGETMEFILDRTGMRNQMLRQLFLKAHGDVFWDLTLERKQLEKTI